MAPVSGARTQGRQYEADRFSRNYEERDSACDRKSARDRPESGQRPAGAPYSRPAGRLRAVARAVEEDQAVAVGRPRAERGRPADRRAGAGDHGFRVEGLLSGRGRLFRHGRRRQTGRFQGRAQQAPRYGAAGARSAREMQGDDFHRARGRAQALEEVACRAFHDFDVAAGGGPQTGYVGESDDVGRPAVIRSRIYYLHAYRLGEPLFAGDRRGESRDRAIVRGTVFRGAQL